MENLSNAEPEIIISYPSSGIDEILYRVKRNCRFISPKGGWGGGVRSDEIIPSGSETGCWEVTDEAD